MGSEELPQRIRVLGMLGAQGLERRGRGRDFSLQRHAIEIRQQPVDRLHAVVAHIGNHAAKRRGHARKARHDCRSEADLGHQSGPTLAEAN